MFGPDMVEQFGVVTVSTTVPTPALVGDAWFDPSTGGFYVYSGLAWAPVSSGGAGSGGGVIISDIPPAIIATGTMWYDTTTQTLNGWDGGAWVDVGGGGTPKATKEGQLLVAGTQPFPWTVRDGIDQGRW